MRALVLGGGGREHALCDALTRSSSVDGLWCAPGNPGIAAVADVLALDPTDPPAVVDAVRALAIDLVVVGPEAPLVAGVTDALRDAGTATFGPTAAAARIEGSKAFAKDVMAAAGVPTAGHWSGSSPQAASAALDRFGPPYVVKADGLAAGKGVVVTPDRDEAVAAVHAALVQGRFGDAGRRLVVEEFLDGPEVSVFAICDGARAVVLDAAQDYKRLLDGGDGPNTGGMGAYSPVPAVSDTMLGELRDSVLQPVVDELAHRGTPFVGVLYAGLVLTGSGARVLEFNARFGDPEAQVVLPRLDTDLGDLLAEAATGRLRDERPRMSERAAVTVVAAAPGYPTAPTTGEPITGIEAAAALDGVRVYQAGTARRDGALVTAGGRVLAVTGTADGLEEARRAAYRALECISFPGLQHRRDVAAAVLRQPR